MESSFNQAESLQGKLGVHNILGNQIELFNSNSMRADKTESNLADLVGPVRREDHAKTQSPSGNDTVIQRTKLIDSPQGALGCNANSGSA